MKLTREHVKFLKRNASDRYGCLSFLAFMTKVWPLDTELSRQFCLVPEKAWTTSWDWDLDGILALTEQLLAQHWGLV